MGTYSDSHSCYFVFDKSEGLNIKAKVYVISDHPSYVAIFLSSMQYVEGH